MSFGIGKLRWPRRGAGKAGALTIVLYRRPYAAESSCRVVGIEEVEAAVTADGPALAMAAGSADGAVFTRLFPLAVRHAIPLTLFIPTAAVSRSAGALTWGQIAEMVVSGIVDVHFHADTEGGFPGTLAALASDAQMPAWPLGDAGEPDCVGARLEEEALQAAPR